MNHENKKFITVRYRFAVMLLKSEYMACFTSFLYFFFR